MLSPSFMHGEAPTEKTTRSPGRGAWWRTRWALFVTGGTLPGTRVWAMGELLCASLTLSTLALAVGLVAASPWVAPPRALVGGPMLVLLAGAVGYGTNFLAVQMLFKPRRPVSWRPMRWIWSQGLVPARQEMLADVVGEEVAARLLTPEAILDETIRLVRIALEDPEAIDAVTEGAQRVLQAEVPGLLRRVLPELVHAFEGFLESEVSGEAVRRSVRRAADEWFADPIHRDRLADFLLDFLRRQSDLLVEIVKKAVKRYRKKGAIRAMGIGFSEATAILDWDDFKEVLAHQLGKPKSRRWAVLLVEALRGRLDDLLDALVEGDWLGELKDRAGAFLVESSDALFEREVVPRLVRFVGSGAFGRYLLEEVVPRARPGLLAWLRGGHLDPILERFDVRGRVAAAAAALEVEELEAMADRVAAYHLGAIQVLGYVLGLIAGVLTWSVDRLG